MASGVIVLVYILISFSDLAGVLSFSLVSVKSFSLELRLSRMADLYVFGLEILEYASYTGVVISLGLATLRSDS